LLRGRPAAAGIVFTDGQILWVVFGDPQVGECRLVDSLEVIVDGYTDVPAKSLVHVVFYFLR
jgi:hypothetical protein